MGLNLPTYNDAFGNTYTNAYSNVWLCTSYGTAQNDAGQLVMAVYRDSTKKVRLATHSFMLDPTIALVADASAKPPKTVRDTALAAGYVALSSALAGDVSLVDDPDNVLQYFKNATQG